MPSQVNLPLVSERCVSHGLEENIMNVSLSIDFNQLKSLITQCGIEEKVEIIRILEKDTFPLRFNQLLSKLKADDLTLEEITAEVETVRQKRYSARR
jgi:hypothetical protein